MNTHTPDASCKRSRRRRLAVLMLTMAMIAAGAIWAISASARVSPINDKFQVGGQVEFSVAGICTFTANGTMPASGAVITASSVTFTKCEDLGKHGTVSATAKGSWTFTLAWGLPATATLSIPNEGLTVTFKESSQGSCTWTNKAFVSNRETWENGVSEKEKETEGALFTKSESALPSANLEGTEGGARECGLGSKMGFRATSGLVWEDLTHTKQAILNGN